MQPLILVLFTSMRCNLGFLTVQLVSVVIALAVQIGHSIACVRPYHSWRQDFRVETLLNSFSHRPPCFYDDTSLRAFYQVFVPIGLFLVPLPLFCAQRPTDNRCIYNFRYTLHGNSTAVQSPFGLRFQEVRSETARFQKHMQEVYYRPFSS